MVRFCFNLSTIIFFHSFISFILKYTFSEILRLFLVFRRETILLRNDKLKSRAIFGNELFLGENADIIFNEVYCQ